MKNIPDVTVVLAMSADGKIADALRSPARFGSKNDKTHLEKQIAFVDGVLFGAATLRAYGTTLTVTHPHLLQHRAKMGKPPQPIHIVITNSGRINPEIRFFQQQVPHWLLTNSDGAIAWSDNQKFENILIFEDSMGTVDITAALQHLFELGVKKIAVLGGGELISSMLELKLINEFWLTVCPLILGGTLAPTPVAGQGFLPQLAPKLQLLQVTTVEQEVFLRYRVVRE
ncbi:MAG: RibD family protein [Calothrix sp. SM1_7_51]|nr:RibD family protein [Calothrix sp. SM1_7_51]